MLRPIDSLVVLMLWCLALPVYAGKPSQQSIQQALNRHLDAINSLEANFTQTTIDASNRTLQQQSGHLWVARPSRFRIETVKPYPQTLVSNGVDFWTWDSELEQVIIKKLDKDVKQVPILLLGGDASRIIRDYKVSHYRDQGDEHFVLQARSTSSLFETLGIAFRGQKPRSISITDSLGQQTRILLSHVIINQPIATRRFSFTPPKGADVIDDRNAH